MKKFKQGVVKRLFSDTIPNHIKSLNDEELLALEKKYHAQRKRLETKNPMDASIQQTASLLDTIQTIIDEEKIKREINTTKSDKTST